MSRRSAGRPTRVPIRGVLRGLTGLFRCGVRSSLVYRFDTAVGFAGMIIQIVLMVIVWRTVYQGHQEVAGIDERTAVGYAVLAACFTTMVTPWQFSSIPSRIRQGQIGVDLIRPLGLIPQSLAQSVGVMAARVPLGVCGLLTGLFLGGLRPSASAGAAVAWLVSMALGIANVLLCNLLISMVAFWTTDLGGPFIVYRFGGAFCSGALIPLWFMPSWLQQALSWLPFQAQMFAPLSIWFGTVSATGLVETMGVQVLWVIVLALVLRLVCSRAVRRVVVLGG